MNNIILCSITLTTFLKEKKKITGKTQQLTYSYPMGESINMENAWASLVH